MFIKIALLIVFFAVMLGGLVIVPIVSLLTKKPEAQKVEQMFSCYNREVVVESKKSLGK